MEKIAADQTTQIMNEQKKAANIINMYGDKYKLDLWIYKNMLPLIAGGLTGLCTPFVAKLTNYVSHRWDRARYREGLPLQDVNAEMQAGARANPVRETLLSEQQARDEAIERLQARIGPLTEVYSTPAPEKIPLTTAIKRFYRANKLITVGLVIFIIMGIAILLAVLIGSLRKTCGYDKSIEPWIEYKDHLSAALVNLAKQG